MLLKASRQSAFEAFRLMWIYGSPRIYAYQNDRVRTDNAAVCCTGFYDQFRMTYSLMYIKNVEWWLSSVGA